MLLYLENRTDETTGVSLDEEAADLIQYEKTYQAVAQFMGKVNQIYSVSTPRTYFELLVIRKGK